MTNNNVRSHFDAEQKVTKWPKKTTAKLEVLQYLFTKFEKNRIYSEKEVNFILEEWHTFKNAVLLRRALVDQGFMDREKDGSKYWITADADKIDRYKIITCY